MNIITREKMLEECVTPNEEVFEMCEQQYIRGRIDALTEFREKINKYMEECNEFGDFVVTDTAVDCIIENIKLCIKECECGNDPVVIEHYIKGVANHKNYFVKCRFCNRRTRDRRLKQSAVDEWNEFGDSLYNVIERGEYNGRNNKRRTTRTNMFN